MNEPPQCRTLVLSGGGARGAYEAGVVAALSQSENFDLVVGTSIGAINAAFVAQAQVDALSSLWQTIGSLGVITPVAQVGHVERFLDAFEAFGKLPPIAKASHIANLLLLWMQIGSKTSLFQLLGVLDRAPIDTILRRNLNVNALKISLVVTASDLTMCTPTAFYAFVGNDAAAQQSTFCANAHAETAPIADVNIVDAVEASAAIPGAFAPVALNLGTTSTRLFVDGGVANNTPIGLAIAAGATQVTVVFVDPAQSGGETHIANLVDVGFSSFNIMQQKILESDLKLACMTNLAVASAGSAALGGKRRVAIRQIRPSAQLALGTLDFDRQAAIDAAFELGLADGASPPPFSP